MRILATWLEIFSLVSITVVWLGVGIMCLVFAKRTISGSAVAGFLIIMAFVTTVFTLLTYLEYP